MMTRPITLNSQAAETLVQELTSRVRHHMQTLQRSPLEGAQALAQRFGRFELVFDGDGNVDFREVVETVAEGELTLLLEKYGGSESTCVHYSIRETADGEFSIVVTSVVSTVRVDWLQEK